MRDLADSRPDVVAAPLPSAVATPERVREALLPAPRLLRPANQARRRSGFRHRAAIVSFVLLVVVPALIAVGYLYWFAADQYHSETAFSVRSEEATLPETGLLGAITRIGGGAGSDAEVLYDFIRSPAIIAAVDARLDLRRVWLGTESDPLFALPEGASSEDLADQWGRMVDVRLDDQAGIIDVTVRAFAPGDAVAIAQAVLDESGRLINRLSEQARTDAIRFAMADLSEAEAALRQMRSSMADFRRTHRMIDPEADVAGQMGVVGTLESELAEALVARDTLLTYADEKDQRVVKSTRRIEAIRARIDAEKAKIAGGGSGDASAEVVGRYEALLTDIEFAQAAYTQALANVAVARAESRRQARYLAVHIEPTRPDTAEYPRRLILSSLSIVALFLAWSVLMVFWYNLRDSF
jgi:capsular polysaccharide transport system permease protein